jgi:hypothetical protein
MASPRPSGRSRSTKASAPPPHVEQDRYGRVESKVRSDVAALISTHPMGEALAEMAFCLARTLDEGAGLAVAAVNRELRANLIELARLSSETDNLDRELSTPEG